jgi:hypothetical protein
MRLKNEKGVDRGMHYRRGDSRASTIDYSEMSEKSVNSLWNRSVSKANEERVRGASAQRRQLKKRHAIFPWCAPTAANFRRFFLRCVGCSRAIGRVAVPAQAEPPLRPKRLAGRVRRRAHEPQLGNGAYAQIASGLKKAPSKEQRA